LEVLVPKNGMIADLVTGISRKLQLEEPAARLIRVFEVHSGKINKELLEDFNVVGVNEFTTLYAEKTPEEELSASEEDRFIYCYHFDKEPNKPHGVPFKFLLKPDEKMKDMRERISKRTGIKGKLLQQIKFAIIPKALYAKPRYLEEEDVVTELIVDGDEMLGLDHVNKNRGLLGKAEGMFIR
jgi:ubiquitin carboxyl-terminal hydrolase 7